jgi:hypothetical protein
MGLNMQSQPLSIESKGKRGNSKLQTALEYVAQTVLGLDARQILIDEGENGCSIE